MSPPRETVAQGMTSKLRSGPRPNHALSLSPLYSLPLRVLRVLRGEFSRVRTMSGEAFTTSLEAKFHLFLQFLGTHLEGVHPCVSQGEQEVGPVEPRDLGRLVLRNQALAIPLDRRRQAHLAGEFLRR